MATAFPLLAGLLRALKRAKAPLKAIKGSRFVLLRGLEHLRESGMTRLMSLMAVHKPLYLTYLGVERRGTRTAGHRQTNTFLTGQV